MDLTSFPAQKLTRKRKGEKWGKMCLDAAEQHSHLTESSGVRSSYQNKKINYDLANDILHHEDIEKIIEPYGITDIDFPAKLQNYPIALPKIDLLVGEELKRHRDYVVRLVNPDAISGKQKKLMDQVLATMQELIEKEQLTEEEANKRLREIKKFALYSFQDVKERNGTRILKYYEKEQNFKLKFNRGFYDVMLGGEEVYCCDILVGEPVMRKVDPLELTVLRNGNSPYIEDADLIIEDGYRPIGKVIDDYWDILKPADIDRLEKGNLSVGGPAKGGIGSFDFGEYRDPQLLAEGTFTSEDAEELLGSTAPDHQALKTSFDANGNVRVMRAVWRSYRKVGICKFYDEEGLPQKKFVDEDYKPKEEEGEEITWKWINEWWEGTKIGFGKEAIYVKVQPRPIQLRKYSTGNLSVCKSGYVGTFYNINSSTSLSLMDRMRPFQYLYNVLTFRLENAFAKSYGKIMKLPVHEKPDYLSDEQWMAYIIGTNMMPVNMFQEGKSGAALGKLAGMMQQGQSEINMEQGQYIQQHLEALRWLKEEVGEISGVSRARQSQISQREAVSNVERSIIQSSHITEKWFSVHEDTKRRVLQTFLETAQYAIRNNPSKRQYVTDDLQTIIMDIDSDIGFEEMGVFVTNETKDNQLVDDMREILKAQAQNDRFNLSTYFKVFSSDSAVDIARQIEDIENEERERAEVARKEELEVQERMAREQQEMQREDLARKERERVDKVDIADKDRAADIHIAEIKSFMNQMNQDMNNNNVPDQLEIEKLRIEERALDIKEKEVRAKMIAARNSNSSK